jgi:hypothetical protein
VSVWKLKGEQLVFFTAEGRTTSSLAFTAEGSRLVKWLPILLGLKDGNGILWLQGQFYLTNELYHFAGGAQPNQIAPAGKLIGLNKGVAYLNVFNIGRYLIKQGTYDAV